MLYWKIGYTYWQYIHFIYFIFIYKLCSPRVAGRMLAGLRSRLFWSFEVSTLSGHHVILFLANRTPRVATADDSLYQEVGVVLDLNFG